MSSPSEKDISDTNKENKQPGKTQEVANKRPEPDDDTADPGTPFPESVVKP